MLISVSWGIITWDLNRGLTLYISIFSKTFTPVITYLFEKKVEHTTKKMNKIIDGYNLQLKESNN